MEKPERAFGQPNNWYMQRVVKMHPSAVLDVRACVLFCEYPQGIFLFQSGHTSESRNPLHYLRGFCIRGTVNILLGPREWFPGFWISWVYEILQDGAKDRLTVDNF